MKEKPTIYPIKQASKLIREWANYRNIINGLNSQAQFLKLIEEWSEAFTAENANQLKDGIGDSYVVLTIIAAQHGIDIEDIAYEPVDFDDVGIKYLGAFASDIAKKRDITVSLGNLLCCLSAMCDEDGLMGEEFTFEEAISYAYHEIKDRKGLVLNGVFVKEQDLPK